jgi:hypothetical protein
VTHPDWSRLVAPVRELAARLRIVPAAVRRIAEIEVRLGALSPDLSALDTHPFAAAAVEAAGDGRASGAERRPRPAARAVTPQAAGRRHGSAVPAKPAGGTAGGVMPPRRVDARTHGVVKPVDAVADPFPVLPVAMPAAAAATPARSGRAGAVPAAAARPATAAALGSPSDGSAQPASPPRGRPAELARLADALFAPAAQPPAAGGPVAGGPAASSRTRVAPRPVERGSAAASGVARSVRPAARGAQPGLPIGAAPQDVLRASGALDVRPGAAGPQVGAESSGAGPPPRTADAPPARGSGATAEPAGGPVLVEVVAVKPASPDAGPAPSREPLLLDPFACAEAGPDADAAVDAVRHALIGEMLRHGVDPT